MYITEFCFDNDSEDVESRLEVKTSQDPDLRVRDGVIKIVDDSTREAYTINWNKVQMVSVSMERNER